MAEPVQTDVLLDEERDEFLDIYRAARRGDADGLAALLTDEDSINKRFTVRASLLCPCVRFAPDVCDLQTAQLSCRCGAAEWEHAAAMGGSPRPQGRRPALDQKWC